MRKLKDFFCEALGIETKEDKEKERQELFINEGEMAFMTEQEPTSDEKRKEKEKEWADVNQDYEYVCQVGTVMCKYHSAGDAKLMPNSTEVMLQDKPYVTEADTDGKTNFVFTGLCTHSSHGSKKPPCKSVINLSKWKNCSTSHIDDYHPILFKSSIPCMVSGEDLKVTNSGQVNRPEDIEPVDYIEIVEMFWLDETLSYKIEHIFPNDTVYLYVRTENYERFPVVRVKIPESHETLIGKVNERGEALIKWTCP